MTTSIISWRVNISTLPFRNLSTQRGVSAQQELLTGLAFGIKRS